MRGRVAKASAPEAGGQLALIQAGEFDNPGAKPHTAARR
jgi:hypothetical protein